ncbi:MAG: carboxypeptidase-like regulatory domain-containing protein [Candidatus Methanoplasma sp.]|jgi:hypothetical protein|nr:carboxypeptidase-like regulatory domain-containing protein [Candidatus Methanoplasma sp.]
MRNKVLLAIIAVALLTLVLPIGQADADVAAPNYAVEGYVAEGGGTGKIPMEGVTVHIMDSQGTVFEDRTNDRGLFRIEVSSNTNLSISFTAFGYTVISCPNTSSQQGSEYLILNLSTAAYNSTTRTYTITSAVSEMQCAIMTASNGVVGGVVYHGGETVKNATVTMTPIDGEGVYRTNTDDRGYYEIKCPTGEYTLTASGKGFEESNAIIVKVTSSPLTANVTIEKNEIKKYLGLDLAHILMLIGVIVGILLAAVAWFLSKRMNGPNRLEIFEDNAEEDEEIRYP